MGHNSARIQREKEMSREVEDTNEVGRNHQLSWKQLADRSSSKCCDPS